MRPVLIVQHESDVAPGHFGTWLQARGLASRHTHVHAGDALPDDAEAFSGICSMGGNMSVNDPLPWVAQEIALLRDAIARGVPVIGHCLGGQLLAAALGAPVRRNAHKEIGWLPVRIEDPAAAEWFGPGDTGELFHWHGDAFELPAGARRLLSSPLTAHQAFVVERAGVEHVGMQFHIEMTPELVCEWTADPALDGELAAERTRNGGPGVQTSDEMRRDLVARTARMKDRAWHLYDRWARGLRR